MRSLTLIAALLAGAFLAGCGSEGVACGPGTIEKDGTCVAAISCGPGSVAVGPVCVPESLPCLPLCAPWQQCGSDGCGGNCGSCPESAKYCVLGTCSATCVASCVFSECGDDGCGGSCGTCADGKVCAGSGRCVPPGWTCPLALYSDGFVCNCACGAPDPDCGLPNAPVLGCERDGARCEQGVCTGGEVSAGNWWCQADTYADGRICDCSCGRADPDCENYELAILGCEAGDLCVGGQCASCQPVCTGKACGDDGCGGSCGTCADPARPVCRAGECIACTPSCASRQCGDDGCGGSCGTCGAGQLCESGQCLTPSADASCAGRCGGVAPAGCSCRSGCALEGSCCADVAVACSCIPVCDGYQCGDDGCGGSCGTCGAGSSCEDHLCIPDPCSPDPCNGHGACAPGAPGAPPVCQCGVGFTGASCNSCASGYAGYPACALDLCPADACSGHGACSPTDGSCTCEAGFRGAACNVCEPGHGLFPHCTVPRCGDGVFDPGEACDDGDTTPGDGCSATCAIEPGWDCTNSPNLNTGSDGAGGQAALGAFDLVWTWSAGPGGTPQPAVVDDNCAPGLWAPEPLWARWISRYGCNQSTPPDTVSHYTATFDIPPGAERITRINGTIWADNAIDDVIVNGTTTGLTSGVEGYQGSGIAFGSWPNSLYRAGRNELTVVVYNAPGTGLNPDGLLVSVAGAFGAGSVCSRP